MKFLIAVSTGLVVFLLAKSFNARNLTILAPSARGLVVGDSLTAHGGYQSTLAGLLPYASWRNVSEVGAGTGRILSLLRGASVEHGPGDAIVLAGINDIASGRSLSTIQSNLSSIYSYLRSHGYRVIAVTTTPWAGYSRFTSAMGEKQRQLNAWIRAQRGNVDCVVDVYSHFSTPSGALLTQFDAGDHLHLNNTGQVELGREIARQAYGLQVTYQ